VRDPRLADLTLVTAVEVARDLAHAKVWISYYGERERLASGVTALNHAAGFIQGILARRIPLRTFPKLHFVPDESMERGFRIVGKLRNLAT
jgi:ribosome-binding factor A